MRMEIYAWDSDICDYKLIGEVVVDIYYPLPLEINSKLYIHSNKILIY